MFKEYGIEGGAFCGVFDGHGMNGHVVSNMVRNRLPSLLVSQKYGVGKLEPTPESENGRRPSKDFVKWKQACISAFKVMDKEIKLQHNLDCSTSGTTAVVVVRRVRKQRTRIPSGFPRNSSIHNSISQIICWFWGLCLFDF